MGENDPLSEYNKTPLGDDGAVCSKVCTAL